MLNELCKLIISFIYFYGCEFISNIKLITSVFALANCKLLRSHCERSLLGKEFFMVFVCGIYFVTLRSQLMNQFLKS